MTLNLFARLAKLVALFGFLLPWAVVSCSGTEIVSATGVQLITGDLQLAGPLANAPANEQPDADPSVWVIASAACGAIGLALSLFLRSRAAAIALAATAVLGAGAAYYGVEEMRGALTARLAEEGRQSDLPIDPAALLQLETRAGYWVTLGGFGGAALLAFAALALSASGSPPNSRSRE